MTKMLKLSIFLDLSVSFKLGLFLLHIFQGSIIKYTQVLYFYIILLLLELLFYYNEIIALLKALALNSTLVLVCCSSFLKLAFECYTSLILTFLCHFVQLYP